MGQVPISMKIQDFKRKKQAQQKIVVVTCYDYSSACIVSKTDAVDCVLVGDSLAMTVHGHDNTLMATIEMMELHTQAVARGVTYQFLVTDLPFLSHKRSLSKIIDNVQCLLRAGAHALKIEGADTHTCHTIKYLVDAGVPIMGHIGLTPQFIHQLGGFRVQGKNQEQAEVLMQQAQDLEQSGCFALVLECIPQQLAQKISSTLTIPTIGIGAGPHTDGQILVWHDLLGLHTEINPKFVRRYAQGKELFLEAINQYAHQVKGLDFPAEEHSF